MEAERATVANSMAVRINERTIEASLVVTVHGVAI
jgi:hypothetical protein